MSKSDISSIQGTDIWLRERGIEGSPPLTREAEVEADDVTDRDGVGWSFSFSLVFVTSAICVFLPPDIIQFTFRRF